MAGYIGSKAVLLSTTAATVTGNSTIGGNLTVDTNTLFVDAANNRVGVGTSSPSDQLTVLAAAGGIGYALVGRAADGYGRLQSYDRSGTVGTGSLAFFEDGTISLNRSNTGSLVENARIDSSGHLIVPAGITLGTAAGVYSAANTLDDYEEGTWTPVSVGTSVAVNPVNSKYTKVGRLVVAGTELTIASNSDGNAVRISLPFSVGADQATGGYVRYSNSGLYPYIVSNAGSTDVVFYKVSTGASLAFSEVSGNRMDIVVVYYADA